MNAVADRGCRHEGVLEVIRSRSEENETHRSERNEECRVDFIHRNLAFFVHYGKRFTPFVAPVTSSRFSETSHAVSGLDCWTPLSVSQFVRPPPDCHVGTV